MRTIHFKSCRISSRISLEKLVSFFNINKSIYRKEYIILNEHHLENILKELCCSKLVYVFEFGCITFVDFDEYEIQMFMEFLTGLVDRIDYSMFTKFAENHYVNINENSEFYLWNGNSKIYKYDNSAISIFSAILAKSVALDKIEMDVNCNIDQSEKFIDFLKSGRLNMNKKALPITISKFLKFEYESINNIRIFDRSTITDNNTTYKELYDSLSEYYELSQRFNLIQNKINTLRRTIKIYTSLSFQQNETRLYLLEIFLLILFPLVSLIRLLSYR